MCKGKKDKEIFCYSRNPHSIQILLEFKYPNGRKRLLRSHTIQIEGFTNRPKRKRFVLRAPNVFNATPASLMMLKPKEGSSTGFQSLQKKKPVHQNKNRKQNPVQAQDLILSPNQNLNLLKMNLNENQRLKHQKLNPKNQVLNRLNQKVIPKKNL